MNYISLNIFDMLEVHASWTIDAKQFTYDYFFDNITLSVLDCPQQLLAHGSFLSRDHDRQRSRRAILCAHVSSHAHLRLGSKF